MKKYMQGFLAMVLLAGTLFCFPFKVCAAEDVCSPDDEQKIWDYLLELTGNPMGTAGIMGNLYFESHLNPVALEVKGKQELTGEEYTDMVDDLSYEDFTTDGYGYGIAQWTYSGRKMRLQELAEVQECSVGTLDVQLQMLGEELEKFNMLYRISNTDSIQFASDYFLINFENPSMQDEKVKTERAEKGQYYFDKYTKPKSAEIVDPELTQAQRDIAQIASNSEAYGITAQEGLCQTWVTNVYRKAGFRIYPSGSAKAAADRYLESTDLKDIPVGAAIYGSANKTYGHVGIYIGDNQVCHNIGGAVTDTLDDWIDTYGGYGWGWPGGLNLIYLP